jgi:hypothetical protein
MVVASTPGPGRGRVPQVPGDHRQVVPAELDVHLVIDNASTHKTPAIRQWFTTLERESAAVRVAQDRRRSPGVPCRLLSANLRLRTLGHRCIAWGFVTGV